MEKYVFLGRITTFAWNILQIFCYDRQNCLPKDYGVKFAIYSENKSFVVNNTLSLWNKLGLNLIMAYKDIMIF